MYKQTCEATHVRARTVVGRARPADVVPATSVSADSARSRTCSPTPPVRSSRTRSMRSNALASLDRCADVPTLRAVIRPPDDPATVGKVASLRRRLAEMKARFDSGRWKRALDQAPPVIEAIRSVGYQPLLAESLLLQGNLFLKASNSKDAEKVLVESFWVSDAVSPRRGARRGCCSPRSRGRLPGVAVRRGSSLGEDRGRYPGAAWGPRTTACLASERLRVRP